ncbi:MAG: metal ABC transporter permease, partial [Candidatus Methanomethylophilus sp.]|nr:metal ABC transporter permease [Methanomethylophilus sp.]
AVIMVLCRRITDLRQDSVIGVLWSVGMALGVIFIQFTDRSVVTPASFETILFGNVLFVGTSTLYIMFAVGIAVLAIVAFLFRDLQILTFDEVQARLSGIRVTVMNLILYILIAVTCVLVANVVGIIMIIALMTIPVATANLFTHSMKSLMALSTVLGMIMSVIGLFAALALDTPPGATVVLAVGAAFVLALIYHRLQLRDAADEEAKA